MTIKDFVYIETILGGDSVESIIDDKMFLMLSYFNNMKLSEIDNMKLYQYQKLVKKTMPKLIRNPKPASKRFYYRKNIWIKKDINELNWGDFVDLYKFSQKVDVRNINFIILKLYKPLFDIKELPNFADLDVNHIYESIIEASKFVADKIQKYKVLFKSDKKEPDNAPKKKKDIWGMLNISFELLNDDITKLPEINKMNIDTIFLYLIWQKQRSEEMMKEINKK